MSVTWVCGPAIRRSPLSVIVAPGISAPLASVTMPVIDPVVCACARGAPSKIARPARTKIRRTIVMPLLRCEQQEHARAAVEATPAKSTRHCRALFAKNVTVNHRSRGRAAGLILHAVQTMRRAIQLFGVLGFTAILTGQSVEQTVEGTRRHRDHRRAVRRPRRRLRRAARHGHIQESVRQFAGRRPESRRPDREFADGDLLEAGPRYKERDACCTGR